MHVLCSFTGVCIPFRPTSQMNTTEMLPLPLANRQAPVTGLEAILISEGLPPQRSLAGWAKELNGPESHNLGVACRSTQRLK